MYYYLCGATNNQKYCLLYDNFKFIVLELFHDQSIDVNMLASLDMHNCMVWVLHSKQKGINEITITKTM
jgi:hypothetical protein